MSRIHFIPHVHWDREWLRSTDSSRVKLVYYFDRLIDMLENDPEMTSFTFDGQTAALEDYLAIKPYQKKKISRLVSERKLFIGPWYVQPDMIIPSGEALLRNLLLGSKYASSMGHCMNVGWVPDAFGQNKITPYLFKEIGMKGIFAWRGFDYDVLEDSLFYWKGNKDTIMPSVHYALGYGHYRGFPKNYLDVIRDMEDIVPKLESRYKDGELLFMLGSDYAFPRLYTSEVVGRLKDDGYDCKLTNPEDYLDIAFNKANENNHNLTVYEGEARSAALGRIHAGITSTRIDVKNAMRYYETMMSKVVEPMIGISREIGGYCDQELVNYFWKLIFKNQFHDSIYGSSPETINQTVENRLLNLRHGLNELVWMNFRYLGHSVDLSDLNENEDIVVLFNTLPYVRNDDAFISMIVRDKNFILKRRNGEVVPYTIMNDILETSHDIEYYNGICNFHDSGEVLEGTKYRVQLRVDGSALPPMGYEILKVCYNEASTLSRDGDVILLEKGMENTYLKVMIENDGTLTVTNKKTNETYRRLNVFVEKGDDGDEYNYSPCVDDYDIRINDYCSDISLLENTSSLITYRIEYNVDVPKEVINHKRSKLLENLKIICDVSLRSNNQKVDFKTTVYNKTCDHIVRVCFDDLYCCRENRSQDQLGTIVRPNIISNQHSLEDGACEYVLPIYAMQRFVKLNHDKSIMSLMSKGPLEYEIENDQRICLTLLRSVGKFGKADLLIRPGRSSGYRMDTPSSQLLNKEVCSEYSLFFGCSDEMNEMIKQAEIINTPIQTRHLNDISRERNNDLSWVNSYMSLDERVELMAFKKAENGDYSVLRILNNRDDDVFDVRLNIPSNKKCYMADALENKQYELVNENGIVFIKNIVSNSFITVIIE